MSKIKVFLDSSAVIAGVISSAGMLGGISQPTQDGVFLEALGSRQTTDPTAFSQKHQGLQNILLRCVFAKEKCPGSFCEGSTTTGAAIPLHAARSLSEFLEVSMPLPILKLSVIFACFIGAKFARLGKLVHLSPSAQFASSLLISTLLREAIKLSKELQQVVEQGLNKIGHWFKVWHTECDFPDIWDLSLPSSRDYILPD